MSSWQSVPTGPIPKPAEPAYVWGAALATLQEASPDLRVVNLETSITRSCEFVPKGINYKMSPQNIACLTAAQVDCCVLANITCSIGATRVCWKRLTHYTRPASGRPAR